MAKLIPQPSRTKGISEKKLKLRTTQKDPRTKADPIKIGKGFTNLFAELLQDDQVRISSHLIFGRLAPLPGDPTPRMTLSPPSAYARRVPLHRHPATAPIISPGVRPVFNFNKHYRVTQEPELAAGNGTRGTAGGGGGAWLEPLTDEAEQECPGGAQSWYSTMVMTLEFKFPIPRSSGRTVGIFTSGTFINDPRGRHDTYVEVWSAPSDIGVGETAVREGWRDKQVCLAVASQMALTVSAEVNMRRAKM
ncbi:hypothetical protein BDZ89DRAFT_1127386 [Hymenopellis radicata]|nr:hypothetical protein BDZ89DRAFT_1127386 [Hymenopellis radicata]